MGSAQFDTDDSELIQTIKDSVKVEVLPIDGEQYTSRHVYLPPRRDLAKSIEAFSLTAIVDYLNSNFDEKARATCIVHVKQPDEVYVRGELEERDGQRFTPLKASADLPNLGFGSYNDLEYTLIALQSQFVQTPERDALIAHLGSIVASESLRLKDDGMTQETTLQKGINREASEIKNPINLAPFRTFPEVDQPVSPFVIRLRKPKEESIQVAIIEADGGAWRNTARLSIKTFLDEKLPTVTVLA